MSSLRDHYLAVHQQAFVPIFVNDAFDALLLADAVVAAGGRVVEITCRRPAAAMEVRAVKRAHPALTVLAGSVVDDGPFLAHLQSRQPTMPSIDQLIDAGVDGIVSALPMSRSTIERVSRTHLVIPGVETTTEAAGVIEAGAAFAKLWTADLSGGEARVARMTCAATHALLPLFVTGGITLDRVATYIAAGAAVVGSGWDVTLGAQYKALQAATPTDVSEISGQCRTFLEAAGKARAAGNLWPGADDAQYLQKLSHVVPSFIRSGMS